MKKKLFIILIFILFFVTGCEAKKNEQVNNDYTSIKYTYTEDDYKYLKEVLVEIDDLIKKGENEARFVELYEWLDDEATNLVTYKDIENINYYVTGQEKHKDKQEYFYNTYLELYENEIDLFEPIYHSSFKEAFYGDMSDSEIEELIEKKRREKKSLPLFKKRNELSNEAAVAKNIEEMKPISVETIKVNNQIAKTFGYDNYLDYAYKEEYGRDYSPNDSKKVTEYVFDYVEPFIDEMYELYQEIGNLSDYYKIEAFDQESFLDNYNVIDSYTKSLGGSVNKIYNDLIKGNYLFVGNDSSSVDAAYTDYLRKYDTPVMYFGRGYYQKVNTFIHEFGHYLSMYTAKTDGDDYDIAETQSQGDEAIFHVFMKNNYTKLNDNSLKMYNYYWLLDTAYSIVNCSLVNACELVLYNESNVTVDNIESICSKAIKDTYKNVDKDEIDSYMDYALSCATTSAGYYISYVTSAISAISIYKNAKDNYEEACKNYLELIKFNEENSYPSCLSSLNIVSAFDKNNVEALFDVKNFRW